MEVGSGVVDSAVGRLRGLWCLELSSCRRRDNLEIPPVPSVKCRSAQSPAKIASVPEVVLDQLS